MGQGDLDENSLPVAEWCQTVVGRLRDDKCRPEGF